MAEILGQGSDAMMIALTTATAALSLLGRWQVDAFYSPDTEWLGSCSGAL